MITQCQPGRRCKRWRTCPDCARIRQAQIADLAERGAASSRRVTYAVARAYDNASFAADRDAFLRRIAKISEGGIWTIETGAISTGLHINIIAGTLEGLTAAKLAEAWPASSHADFWAADIPRRDVRNAAAYAAKQSGFPRMDEYSGRLYGSWGTWKRPLAALAEDDRGMAPVATGLAIEAMLANAGVPEPKPTADKKEDKAAVARDNHLRRLLAAYRGEIALHGYCYIPGYGIATVQDAKRLGLKLQPESE